MRFKYIILFLFLAISCTSDQEKKSYPNIILILADDLGYGDISAFDHNNKIKTPNIDRIGWEGIKFTDAHAPSSVCTPTRYGLLTGRYSWRSRLKSGVLTGSSKALIPNSRSTLASVLHSKGYHTSFIGKWHLGWDWALKEEHVGLGTGWNENDFDNIDFSNPVTNNPNDLGFDAAYGHAGSLDMAPYVYVENGRATAIPDTTSVNSEKYTWWRKGPTSADFVHDDVTPNFFRRSIDYIKKRSKKNQPFFLYLPLPSPHTPILPTKEWLGKSQLNPYGDFVLMIDDYVGQMMNTIDKAGITKNTLIIFTSDNGCSPEADFELLAEKGHVPGSKFRGHKADIFEGGHRVPFLARWPDRIQQGSVSDETICLTDVMATVAEIVEYPLAPKEGEDSYSLLPIFKNETLSAPLREATVHHSINGRFAIRKGKWKLIMCPGSGGWSEPKPSNKLAMDILPKIQLYNLAIDPGELNNVQHIEIEKTKELSELLAKNIKAGRSTPGLAQKNDAIDFDWTQIDFLKEQ